MNKFLNSVFNAVKIDDSREGMNCDIMWLEDGCIMKCSGLIEKDDKENRKIYVQLCNIVKQSNVNISNEHLKELIKPHTIDYDWIIRIERAFTKSTMKL